jgi:hypothetical protein
MCRQIKCQATLTALLVALFLAGSLAATAVAGSVGASGTASGPSLVGPGSGTGGTGGGVDQSGDPDELGIYSTRGTGHRPDSTPIRPEQYTIDGQEDVASPWWLAVQTVLFGILSSGL